MSAARPLADVLAHAAVVVLAAGASSRLGTPKQLVRASEVTLLAHTLREVIRLQPGQVFVVVSASQHQVAQEVAPFAATVVFNEAPERGLSSSLLCGLAAARAADPQIAAVLFTLCDQPHLSAALLEQLLVAIARGPEPIAASAYAGVLGVPAAFAPATFAELAALTGDQGARSVLRRDPARVRAIPFAAGAVDIDSRDDLQKLREQSGH